MQGNILAVGMLPPPYSGQALMFEWAIEALKTSFAVEVIDIQAQRNPGEAGRMSGRKLWVLARMVGRCLAAVARRRPIDILYYCPSGPSRIGVLKDLLLLTILRARARTTIYHYHGTGGVAYLLTLPAFIRYWARRVYFRPDLAIRCASVEPNDAALCEARREVILYNGIPDPGPATDAPDQSPLRFCFIGALTEEKGIFDLVEIARLLREHRDNFVIDLIGEGMPDEIARLDEKIARHGLQDHVVRHGVMTGDTKFAQLAKATLFLFPTFFRAETQPLVAIEAAALGVPCVASDWRGLRSIVVDGETGRLAPPRQPEKFVEAILTLLDSEGLPAMRTASRARFLDNFTRDAFVDRLSKAFVETLGTTS